MHSGEDTDSNAAITAAFGLDLPPLFITAIGLLLHAKTLLHWGSDDTTLGAQLRFRLLRDMKYELGSLAAFGGYWSFGSAHIVLLDMQR